MKMLILLLVALVGCTTADANSGSGSKVCSARLVAGSTTYNQAPNPAQWNPAAQPAKAEPPLNFYNLAGKGNQLLVSTGHAVWTMDLTALTFHRVLGDDTITPTQYQPSGSCASARIMAGDGLAFLPDGRAVVDDAWGNGVIEMSDPSSSSCQAKPIAGTQVAIAEGDLDSNRSYQPGDVIGPGAQARFRRPDDATTDSQGNIYVFDDSNRSVKKIAGDAARTVSTLFAIPDSLNTVNSMTSIGTKLYIAGGVSGGDEIIEIDETTGAPRTVVSGAAFPDAMGLTGVPIAMTGDGSSLFVYLWLGYVYQVAPTDGTVTLLAGKGPPETGSEIGALDVSQPIAGDALPLAFTDMVHGANLYWNQGHLYVPAQYVYAQVLWDVTCN